ncbi:MAG: NADH-quinone oxidoreductase subunit H [Gemmatimonadetes bacterium]|jgi:NADH-quinone oxidoreductase subunit H|nr:NADH-quinone oxidoreductase subunit H [Gemmatimonadota bacterium]
MEYGEELFIGVGKAVVLPVAIMGIGVPLLALAERRIGARMQGRLGPRAAGPFGLFQPLADGLKLLSKGAPVFSGTDRLAYVLAPLVGVLSALAVFAAIPFAGTFTWMGHSIRGQIADPGVIYVLAAAGLGVYAPLLAGWGSGDRLALIGGLSGTVRQISFLLCMGLALLGVCLLHGSTQLGEIVLGQASTFGPLPGWNIWVQPLGFVLFLVGTMAWSGASPFDFDRADGELMGGYRRRYSGIFLAFLGASRYARQIAGAALVVTVYGGGETLPWRTGEAAMDGWTALVEGMAFAVKTGLVLCFFIWVRWSLPRLRYDQAMRLVWRVLIPLGLLNTVGTGLVAHLMN